MRTSIAASCSQASCSSTVAPVGRRVTAPVQHSFGAHHSSQNSNGRRSNLQLCRMQIMPGPAPGSEQPIANDPENLYKAVPLAKGIIQKRLIEKQTKKSNKEFKMAIQLAEDEERKEILLRRESRIQPTNKEELVEYFLGTLADDMQFEVARHRPRLDADFFAYLDKVIGEQRFLPAGLPGEDMKAAEEERQERLAELEMLRDYLVAATSAVDTTVTRMASAKERMTKLLAAKDKKQMILDMAAANEIDQSLMDLLASNIQAARLAEQEDAANFMEKVMNACAKFYVQAAQQAAAAAPAPPQLSAANAAAGQTTTSSGLIIPGARGSSSSSSSSSSGAGAAAAPPKPAAPKAGSGLIIDPKMRPI